MKMPESKQEACALILLACAAGLAAAAALLAVLQVCQWMCR